MFTLKWKPRYYDLLYQLLTHHISMMRCYHRRYVDSETVEKISVIESETQSIEKSVTNININWHISHF